MEVIRYVNGERIPGALPETEVANPGVQEILKSLRQRILRAAEDTARKDLPA